MTDDMTMDIDGETYVHMFEDPNIRFRDKASVEAMEVRAGARDSQHEQVHRADHDLCISRHVACPGLERLEIDGALEVGHRDLCHALLAHI